jgi:four helix bundle protein
LVNEKLDKVLRDQLNRSALSICLNIAEGNSRFSKADRKIFFVIARALLKESIAILDLCEKQFLISKEVKDQFYNKAIEVSKMLFSLIRLQV